MNETNPQSNLCCDHLCGKNVNLGIYDWRETMNEDCYLQWLYRKDEEMVSVTGVGSPRAPTAK